MRSIIQQLLKKYQEREKDIKIIQKLKENTSKLLLSLIIFYQAFLTFTIAEMCSQKNDRMEIILPFVIIMLSIHVLHLYYIFQDNPENKNWISFKKYLFVNLFSILQLVFYVEILLFFEIDPINICLIKSHLMIIILTFPIVFNHILPNILVLIFSWFYLIIRSFTILNHYLFLDILLLFGIIAFLYAQNEELIQESKKFQLLKKSKTLFKNAINVLPETIIIYDEALTPIYFNKKCYNEFGNYPERVFSLTLNKISPYNEGELKNTHSEMFSEAFLFDRGSIDKITETNKKSNSTLDYKFQNLSFHSKETKFENFLFKGMTFQTFAWELIDLSLGVEKLMDSGLKLTPQQEEFLNTLKSSLRKGFVFEDNFDFGKFYEAKLCLVKVNKGINLIIKLRKIEYSDINENIQYEIKTFQSKFLSSISHELRTPVNGSISLLQQVKNQIPEVIYKKLVKPSISSMKIMVFTIHDIVDYSSILRGELTLQNDCIDLTKLVKKVYSLVKLQLTFRNLVGEIEFLNDIPSIIVNDSQRISRVLLNLLTNAVKFTNKGFIKIKVEIDGEDEDIIISVEDTGIGMSKETIKNLFVLNPNSTGMIGLGLTISNEIAKRLSDKNQGISVRSELSKGSKFWFSVSNRNVSASINILSNESFIDLEEEKSQQYSQFTVPVGQKINEDYSRKGLKKFSTTPFLGDNKSIELSLKKDNKTMKLLKNGSSRSIIKSSPSVSKLEISKNFSSIGENRYSLIKSQEEIEIEPNQKSYLDPVQMKIKSKCNCSQFLLVDDNAFNLYVLEQCLLKYDAKCHKAINGKEACLQVKSYFQNSECCKEYLMIYMDIDMPVMNGFEATRFLTKFFNENGLKTIIYACTAFDDEKSINQIFEAGAIGHISKPITQEVIEDSLKKYFGK